MESIHFLPWAWFTTIILILLKAFDLINLGWIWVFAPVWATVALVLVLFVFAFIIRLIFAILTD